MQLDRLSKIGRPDCNSFYPRWPEPLTLEINVDNSLPNNGLVNALVQLAPDESMEILSCSLKTLLLQYCEF